MNRIANTCMCACTFVSLAALPSAGDTFTFIATAGDWNVSSNWQGPSGEIPGSGDTAVIPADKTCTVGAADQTCGVINVQSGGTLILTGKILTLDAATTSTIDGTLQFQNNGELRLNGDLTLNGSGDVTAIENTGKINGIVTGRDLTTSANLEFKGGIWFNVELHSSAAFIVNDADDEMKFGPTAAYDFDVTGAATLTVSAGKATFQKSILNDCAWTFALTGGTIQLTADVTGDATEIFCDVNGGTLDIDANFHCDGIDFGTGGTIQVASGKVAEFISP